MALIICAECGREVSDQAAACPGCGAPTPRAMRPAEKSGCRHAAVWILAIVIGGPIVLFVGSAMIAGTMDAFSGAPAQSKPYTGKLRSDAGTEFELLEATSPVDGACAGWKTVSLQRPGDRASGMRGLMCWRRAGDQIEVNTQDGSGYRSSPRAIYVD